VVEVVEVVAGVPRELKRQTQPTQLMA